MATYSNRNKLYKRKKKLPTQMELELKREKEPDRNFSKGGRSFYFFDFDDNVAFLTTPIYIFEKKSGKELKLSSGEYARIHMQIGKPGPFENYYVDFEDTRGSFRCFRDLNFNWYQKILGRRFGYEQKFVVDLQEALAKPDFLWKGPSWQCFYHAVFNQRPISLITARGHHPNTIKAGIKKLVKAAVLPSEPNYLSVFPVSHPETRDMLVQDQPENGNAEKNVAKLKQFAIRKSVLAAIEKYGDSDYHRFGMSDDDPKNIQLIVEEMVFLKKEFPKMSFFVFDTEHTNYIKKEIHHNGVENHKMTDKEQLNLFKSSHQGPTL